MITLLVDVLAIEVNGVVLVLVVLFIEINTVDDVVTIVVVEDEDVIVDDTVEVSVLNRVDSGEPEPASNSNKSRLYLLLFFNVLKSSAVKLNKFSSSASSIA